LFSLRPEHVSIADPIFPTPPTWVRFRGCVRKRVFNGPSDLVEIQCDEGLTLSVRVPNQGELGKELLLQFPAERVVALQNTSSGL
jgi:hypothetical protein